ncbi:reverse transcriptase domain-containing protein [Tanacetum coccineum]
MPTEMELTLEQTQQGVSYEVSVFTMKMEILLEPTSNKLMVEHAEYDESNTYVLERFNTTAGNPVKKILLKLNLSDHRILKDGGGDFRYSDTTHLSRSVKVLKLKNFKKDATLKLFKNGMSMSVQKSQVHKMAKLQDGVKRLCLVDDLKMLKITMSNTSSRNKLNPEINDHYNIFTRESQKDELKTKRQSIIGLKDALVEMPKFNKWLSSLLRNKEKLKKIAITTVNAECSAIIMNKVLEKLEDPGKFLIMCALQELDMTSALADSGASINLLPHSIYKQLGLEALTPTRMTLELANRSVTHPMGIAEDVVVRVDGFTFLADFVVVNFQPDPRVPIILGRPFLRTAKALIDLYEENLTLRVGKEELVNYADKSEKNKEKKFIHAISIIDFSKDDPFSGSTTIPSDAPFPSSSPMKTSDSTFEKFTDEFTLPNSLPPGNDVSIHKKDFHEETFQIYSNPLFEFDDNFKSSNVNPLFKENDKDVEIKSSLSFTLTSPEESELEVYLERDSIPPGIDLTLPPTLEVLSSNPTSLTLTGEKDLKKDLAVAFDFTNSSILPPPLLDSDSPFTAELSASITLNSLGNEDKVFKPEPSSPRPPPEPPDVCMRFKPILAMKYDFVEPNEDFYLSEMVLSLNVEDVDYFTFIIWTFIPYFTYPEDSPLIFSFRRQLNSGIESSLRLGEQKQAASWEFTPCLSIFYCSNNNVL